MTFKHIFLLIALITNLFSANLDTKIKYNKNILKKQSIYKKQTNKEIKKLASEIKAEEQKYTNIKEKLTSVSNNISTNKRKLKKAIKDIKSLENKSANLKENTKQTEERIVNSIIETYSISLGKSLVNKESISDIINKEKLDIILDNSKDKILKSNLMYFKLQNDKRKNNIESKKLLNFINAQEKQKLKYKDLEKKLSSSVNKLKSKNLKYKKRLEQIVNKQNKLSDLLGNLKILKVKASQKLKLKKLKEKLAKQDRLKKIARSKKKAKLAKNKKIKSIKISKNNTSKKYKKIQINKKIQSTDIDIKVRNIGSSIKGIKTTGYWGKKTIAPLKSYKITKKFGKYYDPVYKIELFNESISMKSKRRNAKVHSVLRGKVVYAKNNAATLGNVVIVKHRNSLHTVYSQLSNIPRSLKVGKWIPKGYVIGRVDDTLVFQATKSNRYINPIKLFK